MSWTAQFILIGETLLGMILGGFIGLNRERSGKPAGFRTHMLVAGTATLLVGLGTPFVHHFDTSAAHIGIEIDPSRIVQAIVIGIGFLGAGTILKKTSGETSVEGLTTSASVLLASAIGVAVGVRMFVAAIGITALALIVLTALSHVERRLSD